MNLTGDTMAHIPKGFYDAAVKIHRPVSFDIKIKILMIENQDSDDRK